MLVLGCQWEYSVMVFCFNRWLLLAQAEVWPECPVCGGPERQEFYSSTFLKFCQMHTWLKRQLNILHQTRNGSFAFLPAFLHIDSKFMFYRNWNKSPNSVCKKRQDKLICTCTINLTLTYTYLFRKIKTGRKQKTSYNLILGSQWHKCRLKNSKWLLIKW